MFEKAARKKLRFNSPNGNLTVEDLWELPLTTTVGNRANLDNIAQGLFKQLKEGENVSFVVKNTKANTELQLKFDIVIHIIKTRQAEAEKAEKARANRDKRQMILGLMAKKENEKVENSSMEELKAILDSMEDPDEE